ncbi:thioredoxin domain-containing protein 5 homolog [Onthophagus taurus]|uniref:thioredoxin domain-containing protein 5 homolog n=1 Tax=Onthophagus taurus TaxID=166361 RepID=UPI000C208360|nr:thioredoxin domain-containing protein 5 homolog [Onthophagus taurus]
MKKLFFLSSLFVVFQLILAHEEDVYTVQYNKDNFEDEIVKKNHFVMFYAPWCGHCKRLAPTWEQLAEMLNEEDSNVRIAKVDCTVDSQVCSSQDVTGYPTLKFFKVGESEAVKFRGTRDLPSLSAFINEQLGTDSADNEILDIPQPLKGLVELTEDSFDKHIESGKHFIKFYAPWCGHCQKLAPTWEELAKSLEFQPDVTIGKVDCTQYRSVCNQHEVKGYPTLLWFEDGKKIQKYQGSRTHEDLKSFVGKMMGSENEVENPKGDGRGESPVVILNGKSFDSGIEKGFAFVKFFAPWCGHCKRLAPTWEELGKKFKKNPNVNIVKVDCTVDESKQLCSDQDVDGFPSIFLYKNGRKVSEYNGNRSLEDLTEFVIKHAGGHDEL